MKKIKSLNHFQKGVLIFMITMTLVFAVVYPITGRYIGWIVLTIMALVLFIMGLQ
jgi:predicted Na+-dependent transporter